MHFYMETKTLHAGLAAVNKALSAHPAMPILEGIYLEATDRGVLLRCSDLSLQIECLLPATVEEYGDTVVPGRLFSEMVRKMSEDTIDFVLSEQTAQLKCGRVKTVMQCMDPDEYPQMAVMGQQVCFRVEQNILRDMIKRTVFSTAQDESKPILTGVLMQTLEQELTMVALDGYRLALCKAELKDTCEKNSAVVPARSLQEIARALQDSDEPVEIHMTQTHILVDLQHTKITVRLLDGDFIRYEQMLPKEHATRVRINRSALYESIDRAMLMAREGNNNLVRFQFEQENMKINSNSSVGQIDEELSVDLMGEPIKIAFNARYFSDVLKVLDDEELYLDMKNNISPCVVRPIQGSAFYYLILPVRILN